jgi:parallel beta-helix repeat protein
MGCVSTSIRYNTIKNTALIEGMGNSGTGTYEAITSFGTNGLIEFNKIDSTGYNGIYFGGNYSVVKNNLITNFCLTKDDGAGIYVGDWSPWVGKKIIGNIILNGKGAPKGTDRPDYLPAEGIYVDDRTANAAIFGNTIANCADAGIKIHNAHYVQINHNTAFNNNIQLLMAHDNIAATSPLRDITSGYNILFSKSAAQLCLNVYSVQDDIISTGNMDSNYYCRPINEDKVIQTTSKIWSSGSITNNLSLFGWQAQYNKDAHSKKTPVTLTDINLIRFEYNSSDSDKIITLNGPYIGVDSAVYLQSVSLKPYTSIILIRIPHAVTRNFSFSASDVTQGRPK